MRSFQGVVNARWHAFRFGAGVKPDFSMKPGGNERGTRTPARRLSSPNPPGSVRSNQAGKMRACSASRPSDPTQERMNAPAPHHEITLDDKYALQSGRAFMTGTQALVRLPMLQRVRDLAAGLNTAGFISGYRGSPVGGFDYALAGAKRFLDEHHVVFRPGVNEDLAATSIWGTQQVNLYPDAKYDGVFAMWYGKGPGVDRCGDVFKHANSAGTSKHGGVLVLAGDDHAAKSSTIPHQSDHQFSAAMMPVLYPSSVQEIIDLGLHGFAMSRYSGCWVGFKCVSDTVESSASVYGDADHVDIVIPDDFPLPAD